jgi:sarcosine oxidase subunit gamma
VLSGSNTLSVFAQTCAIDFRVATPQRVIFTRVAGVNCGILPQQSGAGVSYRLWCDCTYATYLREILSGIVVELGGTYRQPQMSASAVHVLTQAI